MRAVQVKKYDSIENIQIAEVARPSISDGQVLVKVQAAGVGFVDGLKVQGLYQTKDPLPFTPGTEFAGVVEEVADNIAGNAKALARGKRVMGRATNGGLAEYVATRATDLHPLPDDVSFEVGATLGTNYPTALYALQARASLQPGECLLVLGAAGGAGTAAIQIGKLLGAHVIAAVSTAQKQAFAIDVGADAIVDYTQPNWRDALKTATAGHGPDVIFDPVGGPDSEQAFRSIAWNGRHIVVGFASGEIPALKFNLPLLKGGLLVGVDFAQIEQREPDVLRQVNAELMAWLVADALQPVVGKIFDFEDFYDAFKMMVDRSALGKMVVKIDSH
ncbi:MAG: NADPH:quinone oxidoreductase family protein [Hyphomicrobiaceae bacterium]